MSIFSDEIIDEVLAANDIVDIVSSYVKLEKKGKYLFGLCPFHREKTGSFSVTPSKQIFYCYSCQKGGNCAHFIMGVENLTFGEAIKHLAEKARINLPEGPNKQDEERARLKKEVIRLNTDTARFYHQKLFDKSGAKAREYLEGRKLSENIIKKFGLGYSPKDGDALYDFLKSKGYDDALIKLSGLILENSNGGLYDRFRGRVMFPIFDVWGSVIAFGGRVLDDSLPKYINSSETLVYTKGRNLYGMNFVRKTMDKQLIVVEGYMDVISLHQSGITNAVASQGTALTDEQGRLLRRYGEEVIIAFDADQAGQKATIRGLDILDELGVNVKVLRVPKGKDPDEFIKAFGADSFRRIVERSATLLEYRVSLLKEQIDDTTTAGKIDFLNKTSEVLAKIDNKIEREMYIKKLSREYMISEESLNSEILRRTGKSNNKKKFSNNSDVVVNEVKVAQIENEQGAKSSVYEKILLILLCLDNSIFKSIPQELDENFFRAQDEKKLFLMINERLKKGKTITFAEILSNIDAESVPEYVRILEKECIFEDNQRAFRDVFRKVESERLEERQKEILDLLKRNDTEDEIYIEGLKKELTLLLTRRKN